MSHQINPTKHFNKVKQMSSIFTYTCGRRREERQNIDVLGKRNVIQTCIMWIQNTRNYSIRICCNLGIWGGSFSINTLHTLYIFTLKFFLCWSYNIQYHTLKSISCSLESRYQFADIESKESIDCNS